MYQILKIIPNSLEQKRKEALKSEQEADEKIIREQLKYKMDLDGQVDEKQEEINKNYQEFLKEKTLIDDIIKEFKSEQRKKTIEALVKKQVAQVTYLQFPYVLEQTSKNV